MMLSQEGEEMDTKVGSRDDFKYMINFKEHKKTEELKDWKSLMTSFMDAPWVGKNLHFRVEDVW